MNPKTDMDELIVWELQGRATHAERRTLAAWLEASAENRAYYEELRRVWDMASTVSPASGLPPRPRATELVQRQAAEDTTVVPLRPAHEPRRRGLRWYGPLVAAAAMVGLVLGVGIFTRDTTQPAPFFGAAEFSTGPRERVTVRLADGSIVRLGPSSTLQLDGSDGNRNVWLEGDAFFAVARHEDSPFVVQTRVGSAHVLGTRFDLHARDENLRLVVVDGRVRVASGSTGQHAEEVGPSEMSHIIEGGRPYVSQVPDVYALLDWMKEALVFQATGLDRVAEELEYRYGVPVEVVNPDLVGRTITAWFTDEPLDVAVTVICRVAEVRCDVSEAGVRIGL